MGLYTGLVANILFPIQEKLKKHDTLVIRKVMDDSQWWSSDRLEKYRLERLRSMLVKVKKHVPYYRDCFAGLGFKPEEINSLADLQKLPLLTKAIIRTEGDRMKSDIAQGLARFNTGGSSGEPLIFFIGTERVSHDVAAKWRATRWWDVDIGDPEIVVWGSPIELGTQDRVRGIRDKLMRTELMPAFQMNEANLNQFVARIRERHPKMLFGYPSAISHIAAHAKKRGIALNDLGIKVVFCTSERLYDHQREAISSAFACPVANGYGGRDAGFIAHECPAGGMHITAEDIIVEIIDENGSIQPTGIAGEIVVTHLATSDFPFIRYRTGDVGSLSTEKCACGRGLPLLKEIQGRSTDFVIATDGTVMHGLALIYILRDLPGVRSFKVIQESRQLTNVLLVIGPEFQSEMIGKIIEGFKQRLGSSAEIKVQTVENIPPEKSGKYRYVISRIEQK
ncbi:MAG: phenylacetate--CoA ligase family protein [Dechloromonas sp.]|nr:phenylacetate--CoA ligase family protein [Candidatus Dechloromonas phosphoritropha]MBP8787917.1 phenylacetate--CoA ligase family protein [Azonexus sp.]MBP9228388.1 phenylacetate--CoA ligase family protein [Azonexus sp.]